MPHVPLASPRYIGRSFARTRHRLETERRSSLAFRRLEWIVSAVRERLRSEDPQAEIAEALPQAGSAGSGSGAGDASEVLIQPATYQGPKVKHLSSRPGRATKLGAVVRGARTGTQRAT
jgi:hypothetical protein